MRSGTWKVRCVYRIGSLKIVASELAKYNLDQMAIQEVRWVERGSQHQRIIYFAMEMGKLIVT
jgi:hypothetical protein